MCPKKTNKVGDWLFNAGIHLNSKALALLELRVPIVNLRVKSILDKNYFLLNLGTMQ